MAASKTTADKKDAYKIRSIIEQAVFKRFLSMADAAEIQLNECDRAMLSRRATAAALAITQEPKIEIILKRRKHGTR